MPSIFGVGDMSALALHIMAMLAMGEGRLTAASAAHRLSASQHTLHKVMRRLTEKKLIHSRRGPDGGFTLAVDPSHVRLSDIIEVMGEEVQGCHGCLFSSQVCEKLDNCLFGGLTKGIYRQVVDYFTKTTLADLVGGKKSVIHSKDDKLTHVGQSVREVTHGENHSKHHPHR